MGTSMASTSFQITNLLEKMTSTDKDFRFMATNDLMIELQKDSIEFDNDSERKVVKMLLRLLEDKNGEVQNLAVKCLGLLINKVDEIQVEFIVETLCANMVSDKERLRDISSICLKNVILELPRASRSLSSNMCKKITEKLTVAIERQPDVFIQLEALDILADLLLKFGPTLHTFHVSILSALLPLLGSQRQAVIKRTITACSNLVISCDNAIFMKFVDYLFEGLRSPKNHAQLKTFIQCSTAICQQSNDKFGEYVPRFAPLILQFIEYEDDDLRKICLQAFETFIIKCPKKVGPYLQAVTNLSLKYLTHDPNSNQDEDSDKDLNEDSEENEEYDEYSDNDDVSWKVRRAAAKCLQALTPLSQESFPDFFQIISPALIARFNEREENVKNDIFLAYTSLLKQMPITLNLTVASEQKDMLSTMFQQQIDIVVKNVQDQMRKKSVKTRQSCFLLLKEISIAVPGALSASVGDLISGTLYSLKEKSSSGNMKIEALQFIHILLANHPPQLFHPHVEFFLPTVLEAVNDNFYKISAEALTVLKELVKVIRPLNMNSTFDFTPYVEDIYFATLMRLRIVDIDQEVKEKAISTMGQIICNLGDYLNLELVACYPLLLDRLKNETTGLMAVRSLITVTESPLSIELVFLRDVMPILGQFLRKNQRALKVSTLQLLDSLLTNCTKQLNVELLQPIVVELPLLLDDGDIQISQGVLTVLKSIAIHFPKVLSDCHNSIIPQIILLMKSPLLQGNALQYVLDFFKTLVKCNLPDCNNEYLLKVLLQPIYNSEEPLHKQSFYTFAKCVAAITDISRSQTAATGRKLISEIKAASTDSQKIFALLVVGEIGRDMDLTSVTELRDIIYNSFSDNSEDIKTAASFALGSIFIGNLGAGLIYLLNQNPKSINEQFLLLLSLRETISGMSHTPKFQELFPLIPAIWEHVYDHRDCAEERTRNVVAECLGKLTLLDPERWFQELKLSMNSLSTYTRLTAITAVKFTISDQPTPGDPFLKLHLTQFLDRLQDPDINVRKMALIVFNTAAHKKPSLIKNILTTVLPQIYRETQLKKELIREVEMGPFSHSVDDGLDVRKAAYECMYTLLDCCLDSINIFEFINHVETGLQDHYDIKILAHFMVVRLCHICPDQLFQVLDKITEPLKSTFAVNTKLHEYEKQDELKKSAMRAVVALWNVPDAVKNSGLNEFVNDIKTNPDLAPMFEFVQRDSKTLEDNLMDQS